MSRKGDPWRTQAILQEREKSWGEDAEEEEKEVDEEEECVEDSESGSGTDGERIGLGSSDEEVLVTTEIRPRKRLLRA